MNPTTEVLKVIEDFRYSSLQNIRQKNTFLLKRQDSD